MRDPHAVFLVDHTPVVAKVELVDLDVPALADGEDAERIDVPAEHHLHTLDHLGRAVLGCSTARSVHSERIVPASGPGAEHPDVGQTAEVIDVQVRDEDVLDLVQRDAGSDVVRGRALAQIEHEVSAVAELHEDRRVHLSGSDRRRRAHEDDPHLVRLNFLGTWEPVRCALHPGRGSDPFEEQPLLPAIARYATEERGANLLDARRILNGGRRRGRRQRGRAAGEQREEREEDRAEASGLLAFRHEVLLIGRAHRGGPGVGLASVRERASRGQYAKLSPSSRPFMRTS